MQNSEIIRRVENEARIEQAYFDAIDELFDDYVMSEAEANALFGKNAERNKPRIKAKSCPVRKRAA